MEDASKAEKDNFDVDPALGVRSLVAPGTSSHLSDCVVDGLPLPFGDPSLFVTGTAPGRAVLPPDWPILAVRLDFSGTRSSSPPSKRDRCFRGGCSVCGSRSWHR